MQDALERARTLVAVYDDEVDALRPNEAEIFDAHVHVGTDIDGFVSTLDDLLAFLAKDGVSRGSRGVTSALTVDSRTSTSETSASLVTSP